MFHVCTSKSNYLQKIINIMQQVLLCETRQIYQSWAALEAMVPKIKGSWEEYIPVVYGWEQYVIHYCCAKLLLILLTPVVAENWKNFFTSDYWVKKKCKSCLKFRAVLCSLNTLFCYLSLSSQRALLVLTVSWNT